MKSAIKSAVSVLVLSTGVGLMIHGVDSPWIYFGGCLLLGVYVVIAEEGR